MTRVRVSKEDSKERWQSISGDFGGGEAPGNRPDRGDKKIGFICRAKLAGIILRRGTSTLFPAHVSSQLSYGSDTSE